LLSIIRLQSNFFHYCPRLRSSSINSKSDCCTFKFAEIGCSPGLITVISIIVPSCILFPFKKTAFKKASNLGWFCSNFFFAFINFIFPFRNCVSGWKSWIILHFKCINLPTRNLKITPIQYKI